MFSKKPADQSVSAPPAPRAASKPVGAGATFSVIGADVTIKGDIMASADLHIDGTIEGDIRCASLVQGEGSAIHGAVTAESARLAGKVTGSITARELVILKSARIEGDVHYDALTIEQGAQVDGRFAPNGRQAVKAVPPVSIAAAE
jgi:cytoskeletal protein CcmA (bactofilin family)